jgi:hypothetical protein
LLFHADFLFYTIPHVSDHHKPMAKKWKKKINEKKSVNTSAWPADPNL